MSLYRVGITFIKCHVYSIWTGINTRIYIDVQEWPRGRRSWRRGGVDPVVIVGR